jgi:hypothetical protein
VQSSWLLLLERCLAVHSGVLATHEPKLYYLADERIAGEDGCSGNLNALSERLDRSGPVTRLSRCPLFLNITEVLLVCAPPIAESLIVYYGEDPREKEVAEFRCKNKLMGLGRA